MSQHVSNAEVQTEDVRKKSVMDKSDKAGKYTCANNRVLTSIAHPCTEIGDKQCKKCQLVGYCSRKCQIEHWPTHKTDCNSSLGKNSWQPAFELEQRLPKLDLPHNLEIRYLFGNTPASDLLNLKDNESATHNKDLQLCYAASGDPRNIMVTVLALPATYEGKLTTVVNDIEPYISLRNIIIFLVASELCPVEATEAILHIWNSASISDDTLKTIQKIRDRIEGLWKSSGYTDCEELETMSMKIGNHYISILARQWRWIMQWLGGLHLYSNEKAQSQR